MTQSAGHLPPPQRITSGIEGLDHILQGGFLTGSSYLIMGPPGTGKTILSNQFCFHHVANGGRAIYLTLLAETNSAMLANIQSFSFFTLTPVADTLSYLSGYAILEQEGLEGLTTFLLKEIRRHHATLLIIDGAITAKQAAKSAHEWAKFLHNIHVAAEISRCTTFLLMPTHEHSSDQPELSMADGLISLTARSVDMRTLRELQVLKIRGSRFVEGHHLYAITETGFVVHPRTEAILTITASNLPDSLTTSAQPTRMRVGIDHLDEMLHGGLPGGSSTLLLGTSGTGKTLLGNHFLVEGATQGQKGLYFGFNETPAQLLRTMARFGLDANRYVETGLIKLLWQSPVQDSLDILAEHLMEAVLRQGTQRLFLDGLTGFQHAIASAERFDLFLTALFTNLRMRNVTVVCAVELPDLFSPTITLPLAVSGATTQVDNILLLRYVELRSQLYRLISIMKMRDTGYDPAIREFRIQDEGIKVASTFDSAQAILTGIAHSTTSIPRIPPAFEAGEISEKGQHL
ncbi:MAG TPA: ATPase domain-containing protein [Ktedonobacteraceae bacterium]